MTPSTTHQARIHRISEGVVASYIHDISTNTAVGAPSATARRGHRVRRAAYQGSGVSWPLGNAGPIVSRLTRRSYPGVA